MRVFALLALLVFITPYAILCVKEEKILPESAALKIVGYRGELNLHKSETAMCSFCVQLMSQTLSTLLQIISQVGVIGSCSKLCSYLSKYGQGVVTGCNLLCDIVGITVFVKLVKAADLNPIWLCQQIKLCPVNDCPLKECAKIHEINVIPIEGKKGTIFTGQTVFEIFNQTSPGLLSFKVVSKQGRSIGGSQFVPDGFKQGVYSVSVEIDSKGNDDFPFLPGPYQFVLQVCEGMCSSRHSHNRELTKGMAPFNVTK